MTIGSFILIRNEAAWIGGHIEMWLPFLDEMVFFDGNSTDGTLEIIKDLKNKPGGHKIRLYQDKDPKNLQEDYVDLFNRCMWTLRTDYAYFLHPDMIPVNPAKIRDLGDELAHVTHLTSYAGDPGSKIYRIDEGRGELWKNIYRLRNPDLGAHYHGFYGAANEDIYFKEITGGTYEHYGQEIDRYPYPVGDSGVKVLHFSDVRTKARRIDRMTKILINQGMNPEEASRTAPKHPRVTFEDGMGFKFVAQRPYPGLGQLKMVKDMVLEGDWGTESKALEAFRMLNTQYYMEKSLA